MCIPLMPTGWLHYVFFWGCVCFTRVFSAAQYTLLDTNRHNNTLISDLTDERSPLSVCNMCAIWLHPQRITYWYFSLKCEKSLSIPNTGFAVAKRWGPSLTAVILFPTTSDSHLFLFIYQAFDVAWCICTSICVCPKGGFWTESLELVKKYLNIYMRRPQRLLENTALALEGH